MYTKFLVVFLLAPLVIKCKEISDKECDLRCAEEKFIDSVDRIDRNGTVGILGDFLVLERRQGRGNMGSKDLFEACLNFLQNYELKLRIPEEVGRSLKEESRTKKKIRRRIILPILIVLALKGFIEFPALLALVGLVAFKGLGVSFVSLAVAAAIGFRNLFDGHNHHNSKLTYEIVPSLGPSLGPHWSRGENLQTPIPEMYN